MRSLLALPFIALTFFCWGNYGPFMHLGTRGMENSRFRPFICVGLAYFLIAVVVPLLMLRTRGEKGRWTISGAFWSLAAGSAGALGALGIIMAMNYGGKPVFVMPLVFGLAPVVNTFVTMAMNRTIRETNPIFLAGVLAAALGAAGVMYFKPASSHGPAHAKPSADHSDQGEAAQGDDSEAHGGDSKSGADGEPKEKLSPAERNRKTTEAVGSTVLVLLSIGLTALSWGAYGPVLHKGQMKMQGSRLRPLLCVGLAYFAIAVIIPLLYLNIQGEPGSWFPQGQIQGFLWSMAAGAAGAIGALGIILAFNTGAKPVMVMPLVFGFAPVVNTFNSMLTEGTLSQITPPFYASLALGILGAVTVLVFAPKGHGPAPGGHAAPAKDPPHSIDSTPARGRGADEDETGADEPARAASATDARDSDRDDSGRSDSGRSDSGRGDSGRGNDDGESEGS